MIRTSKLAGLTYADIFQLNEQKGTDLSKLMNELVKTPKSDKESNKSLLKQMDATAKQIIP
jgi:hypothetical protein